jgi:hypothetical protein
MGTDFDQELGDFKSRIDLQSFAASPGYEKDKRESSRRSTIMRNGADKVIVKRNGDGHYIYFSVRDDNDNGTVIDFLQRRKEHEPGRSTQGFTALASRPCGKGSALSCP